MIFVLVIRPVTYDLPSIGMKRGIDNVNHTVVYKCTVTENEKFLLFDKIPAELIARNDLRNHLFIRDCFPALFDDIVVS